MDSRGSKNDNLFTDVIVTIGETLFNVLQRLGLNDNQAQSAVQLFQDNIAAGASSQGFVKNADGELAYLNPVSGSNSVNLSELVLQSTSSSANDPVFGAGIAPEAAIHTSKLPPPTGSNSNGLNNQQLQWHRNNPSDNNDMLDQDEVACIKRAIAQIGPYQYGAPLADVNGNWTGQFVDRQGNKYYPANNSGGPFDDSDEAYALQVSMTQIPVGAHGGPLYNPDGSPTGSLIDRGGVVFTPTYDQGPFNNLGLGLD